MGSSIFTACIISAFSFEHSPCHPNIFYFPLTFQLGKTFVRYPFWCLCERMNGTMSKSVRMGLLTVNGSPFHIYFFFIIYIKCDAVHIVLWKKKKRLRSRRCFIWWYRRRWPAPILFYLNGLIHHRVSPSTLSLLSFSMFSEGQSMGSRFNRII